MSMTFGELQDIGHGLLEEEERRDLEVQTDLFDGRGRRHVRKRLERLGMGIYRDENPIETGLLQSILAERAVTYARPPVRSLRGMDETSDAHRRMTTVLSDIAYDAFLRELDVKKVLWRTVVVRFYWSAERRRVVPRMFGPLSILRAPGNEPDTLSSDRAFALQRSDGHWEMWTRDGEAWRMLLHTEKGEQLPVAEQPFAMTEGLTPYETLPAVVMYDGYSDQAFLRVPSYRTAFALGIATAANEIMEAIRASSRTEVEYEQLQGDMDPVDPKEMPKKTGPGIRHVLPPGVQGRTHDLTPRLADSLATIEKLEAQWLRSEGIDPGFFRKSQSITAAGLRVLQAPLRELQERLRPWAIRAEQDAWRALRAVHNHHRPDEALADTELDVQLPPLDVPMDPNELSRAYLRSRAAGVASVIDHIQAEWNVGRDEAIDTYNRIAQDAERFPVLVNQAELEQADAGSGERSTNPTPTDLEPADSVVDNVRSVAN